ncbi:MAG: hypothetical protein KJN97_00305 [Deltaproteobacteria bacterium]|nr:hypothetical protein [Deltaproteobacteria bacterium]
MPDLHLVSILAVDISGFIVAYHCCVVFMNRGDEGLAGVVKGIPISQRTRWLILLIHYMPYGAFCGGWLVIISFGLVGLARGAEDPFVRSVGYMSAVLFATGAAVLITSAPMWLYHVRAETRRARVD